MLSVSGAVASRFPYMVDYESSGCERPFVMISIMDKRVVDLLSQPEPLLIHRQDSKGRKQTTRYTPDYLRIRREQIALVEVKSLQQLRQKSEESPDWVEIDGRWKYLPAEAAAASYGIEFEIFFPEAYSQCYLANLQYLVRTSSEDLLTENTTLIQRVRRHLLDRPQSITQLCARFSELTGAWIYQAISAKQLFGFIEHQLLEPDFIVYANEDQAASQAKYLENSSIRRLSVARGPIQSRYASASKSQVEIAKRRRDTYLERKEKNLPKNATDYRLEVELRAAKEEGADELAAFVPRTSSCGRKPWLPELIGKEVREHAESYLSAGRVPNQSKIYADYVLSAKEAGSYVPSQESHRKIFLSELSREKAAYIAGGKKGFHAERPRVDGAVAVARLDIAALHVHIDGVYGDVRAARDEEGEYARPIFYPMVDDASGYVPGRGVKLGRGCLLAVAMAHRDCYQRHGLLPSKLIHDWGGEFVNTFVPAMTAHFGTSYERRPKSAPRFGAMGEMFNAQFSSFLQNLDGGTYFDKLGRSVDGSKKSRARAKLSIAEIIYLADEWIFEVWNKTPIGDEKQSPEMRWKDSLRCFPEAAVKVLDDLRNRYETSVPLKAKVVSYTGGYRVGDSRYTSTDLPSLIRNRDTPTDFRLDCMNPSVVYGLTSCGPVELRSLDFIKVDGLTFDRRMQEMHRLLRSRSESKRNQQERNEREAGLVRAGRAGSKSQEENQERGAPASPANSNAPDFSSQMRGAITASLKVYGS